MLAATGMTGFATSANALEPDEIFEVTDLNPGTGGSSPLDLTVVGDNLYFLAYTPDTGSELYVHDGTNTTLVADLNPGTGDSSPRQLTAVGDNLYFRARTPDTGNELYVHDGTNTTLVADLNPGTGSSTPGWLTAVGDNLYFHASTPDTSNELYIHDGTNTTLVADLNPSNGGSSPRELTAFGDNLYFRATTPETGDELWVVAPDSSAPEIEISAPQDSAIVSSDIAVQFDCTDAGGPTLPTCTGSIDSGASAIAPGGTLAGLTEGSHTLTVTSTDSYGNAPSQTVSFTVDDSSPAITIASPVTEMTVAVDAVMTVDYTCTDPVAGVDVCGAWLNGVPVSPGTALDTSAEGLHVISFVSSDRVGNNTVLTRSVTVGIAPVDTTAPTVTIDTPSSAVVRETDVRASFSCTDGGGSELSSCVGLLDGSRIDNGATINTSAIGTHELVVIATDGAGNVTVERQGFDIVPASLAFDSCDRALSASYQAMSGADASVARLYMAVFTRQPDADGHAFWSAKASAGMPLEEIAASFAASPEFDETYGETSNRDFVELAYNNVMCRLADTEGSVYWQIRLQTDLGREAMILQFSDSKEFRATTGSN